MEKKWHELITREIVGLNLEVPLIDGTKIRYINLDNAATTPPLNRVAKAV
ncbi:MAG TPA: aminotransferase, partial [Firmicutes bacterium]|nr:aminotransferase [Bacillota bacterium]